jgi:hypothetical protein
MSLSTLSHFDFTVERLAGICEDASRIRKQVVAYGESCRWSESSSPSEISMIVVQGNARMLEWKDDTFR